MSEDNTTEGTELCEMHDVTYSIDGDCDACAAEALADAEATQARVAQIITELQMQGIDGEFIDRLARREDDLRQEYLILVQNLARRIDTLEERIDELDGSVSDAHEEASAARSRAANAERRAADAAQEADDAAYHARRAAGR